MKIWSSVNLFLIGDYHSYLKILQKVSIGHPKAAIVESFSIEFPLDSRWQICPPGVIRIPSPGPHDQLVAGAVFDTDNLPAPSQISYLCYPVKRKTVVFRCCKNVKNATVFKEEVCCTQRNRNDV